MSYVSIFVAGCVGWYTVNVARLAWRHGNKAGAAAVGALALIAFALPTALLLLRES
ncbi:MAG TPA: hypothetical protein VK464_03980 [Symbiobacteriaceae bacterium]|nr:hypothetical protein [Symbiobacteriaceae bacterium]